MITIFVLKLHNNHYFIHYTENITFDYLNNNLIEKYEYIKYFNINYCKKNR